MSSNNQSWEVQPADPAIVSDAGNWYALQTRARHEKVIAQRLQESGLTTFLPMVTEVHRWSDRKKTVELPLFTCYLFVKVRPTSVA